MRALGNVNVYVAVGATDMRKAINGLTIMVEHDFDLDPFCGHLFAFCNRRRTIVKVLYWERNGFCLWQKRLEKHFFRWPQVESEVMQIDHRQLMWLLDGLEIRAVCGHEQLRYSSVY